ncbi:molybdenum cofactor synthesis domain-containing protein [Dietzia sp. 2505]|jgi:molybdenum cofactor synthesis domain-containing protein|uniref:MogA/MoaB family molybdenum cofactor biosynthesis protein n=1 Tax=Dietzia TaxID=37914 RepID=UPI0015C7E9C6|nr:MULTISPECIES: molybdopterin-binding protein [Dietzia]MBB1033974.1 molybdenum cofactor biosynthesis protein [Dietzia sp. CQ4]MBB1038843.1 molybdenum cofactor biosynthesis protein [Dietzia natronolimnaea]MBB1051874.1 molybdenum cofactor biosynthesis protein [Dietzia sp. CW19]MBB1056794.1 molybdenum cofactor biosynthesis protein [Dietzia sp. B19]MCT1516568.1 molybdopterin-binding protein [Dietzia cercidiphylli]
MSTRFDPRSLPGGRRIQTDVDFDPSAAVPADTPIAGRAMVVVVTDRLDPREDSIGPLVTELLEEEGFLVGGVVGVASEESEVRKALETAVVGGFDFVVTVGGTGVGPRDITPEVTEEILDQRLPGIAEAIRSSGLTAGAVDSIVSRGLVGVSGSTVVANLAPSRAAIRDGMATLCPLVSYVVAQLSAIDEL